MIGISSYFQDLNIEYIEEAIKCGVTHIFTSLVVLEEDYSDLKEKLGTVLALTKKYGVTLIPDISPITLKKLDIDSIEEIKSYGFDAIRIDGGFGTLEESKKLIELFEVYLNASDVKVDFINQLRDAGCNMGKISVLHNFYPRLYTGLNKEHFVQINKDFKSLGLKVAAFVQGDVKLRGPVYEGLPTLEKHRGVHPFVACVELLNSYVDDVYVGDNEASIESIKMMINYSKNSIISLKAILDEEYNDLYDKEIPIRRDITDHLIRLSFGRGHYKDIKQHRTLNRLKGSITIDNNLSGRYVGEINIVKDTVPADGKINIIGHIYPEYLEILNYINRDAIIKFVK